MVKITKENITELADVFNTAVKNFVFAGYERIELFFDEKSLPPAEFLIYPSDLQTSLGVECQSIVLPEEFNIENISSLSDIADIFKGNDMAYIRFIWRDEDRVTFIEVSPCYVDFGESRLSDNSPVFQIQLLYNYKPRVYTN